MSLSLWRASSVSRPRWIKASRAAGGGGGWREAAVRERTEGAHLPTYICVLMDLIPSCSHVIPSQGRFVLCRSQHCTHWNDLPSGDTHRAYNHHSMEYLHCCRHEEDDSRRISLMYYSHNPS